MAQCLEYRPQIAAARREIRFSSPAPGQKACRSLQLASREQRLGGAENHPRHFTAVNRTLNLPESPPAPGQQRGAHHPVELPAAAAESQFPPVEELSRDRRRTAGEDQPRQVDMSGELRRESGFVEPDLTGRTRIEPLASDLDPAARDPLGQQLEPDRQPQQMPAKAGVFQDQPLRVEIARQAPRAFAAHLQPCPLENEVHGRVEIGHSQQPPPDLHAPDLDPPGSRLPPRPGPLAFVSAEIQLRGIHLEPLQDDLADEKRPQPQPSANHADSQQGPVRGLFRGAGLDAPCREAAGERVDLERVDRHGSLEHRGEALLERSLLETREPGGFEEQEGGEEKGQQARERGGADGQRLAAASQWRGLTLEG